tara:strand:- start:167 stop:787 length:621 start_codon:yes stop_codon:yes gene_type:complete
MKNYKNVCVAILSGGKSSRMGGGIKTFIQFNNKTIFERILNNIKKQSAEIIVNSNQNDEIFYKYELNIINDELAGFLGPLAGIHACMNWILKFNKEIKWLVTVPSDTPFLPEDLVQRLHEKVNLENLDIVLAKSNKRVHPIVGIWNIALFDSLENELKNGTRKIMNWATKHSVGYVEFKKNNYDPFFNINFKEDIIEAERIENIHL